MPPDRACNPLRRAIATTAARLLAEHESTDYASARRKAAKRLNGRNRRQLPDNREIEVALLEYQQLFQQAAQPMALRRLRQTAVAAMQGLERFDPRLVGPVLTGSASQHMPIILLLFCETTEELLHRLMELKIPWEQSEISLHYSGNQEHRRSLLRFHAGDDAIELIVLPLGDRRNPPVNPLTGRPDRGAPLSRVRALLD